MNPDQNFKKLGPIPTPPFNIMLAPIRKMGDSFYVSGQIATRNGELIAKGLVGSEVNLELAQRCAWQCAINIMESVQEDLGSLSKIAYVVRLGIYVASDDGFTDQHLVGHGASQAILDVFGPELGKHSRTAIGVKSLPLNSPVEVDAVFALRE